MAGSVLIIDAEEPFVQNLSRALRSRGIETLTTADGNAGRDLAQLHLPGVIVLCVELPRMSGYTVCAKLKKDPVLKSIPLVITSAEATDEHFEHHRRLKTRAEEYLKKPFEPDQLLAVIEPLLALPVPEPAPAVALAPARSQEAAFVLEEPLEDPGLALDDALHALAGSDPSLPPGAFDLGSAAGLGEGGGDGPEEAEEAMTTVGEVPTAPSVLHQEIEHLRAQLADERSARERAERERDSAVRSSSISIPPAQTSSGPTSAVTAGRDVVALKKEVAARDREILELRDQLQRKDREALDQREREADLEGRFVQLEEERDGALGRVDALRQRLAEVEAQAAEQGRGDAEAIAGLERQLAEASAREAELDGALQDFGARTGQLEAAFAGVEARAAQLEGELAEVRATLDVTDGELRRVRSDLLAVEGEASARKADVEALQLQRQALTAELTRLSNESAAAAAESESLRQQVVDARADWTAQGERRAAAEESLRAAEVELEALRGALADADARVARAVARVRSDEDNKAKARQALNIALALIQTPQVSLEDELGEGGADDVAL